MTVTFRVGTDVDLAQVQVQNRVSQALPRLPDEVRQLGVTTVKSSPNFIMVVHLVSPDKRYNDVYLRNYGLLQIKDVIARIPGIGQVQVFGGGDYAMRIWLDPGKVAARGLTASDVVNAIREQNVQWRPAWWARRRCPCRWTISSLGAAVVIVGDLNPERLAQARSFGCETVNVAEGDPLDQIMHILGRSAPAIGQPLVDAAVDAVGFEARGHGDKSQTEMPATVLNSLMDLTRAGGAIGIPGLYVTGDPGGVDEAAKVGSLSIRLGLGWAKSHSFVTGQCPVMKYNRELMMAILYDRVQIAKNVNATPIPIDQAPKGYQEFDKGAARKYVLDPHGILRGRAN